MKVIAKTRKGKEITFDTQIAYPKCFLIPNETYSYRNQWFSCRELFSPYFTSATESFMFSVKENDEAENISNFFKKIEDKLNLNDSIRISSTSSRKVVLVEPSKWWAKSFCRRQLLTILLRCSLSYKGNNFEEALYSIEYASGTRNAVERFLNGYTYGRIYSRGWYATFKNKPKEWVDLKLIKHPKE